MATKYNHSIRTSAFMTAAILFAACSLVVLTVDNALADTDTTPPDTTITSGPSGTTENTTPTFTFSGIDDVSQPQNLQYSYKLDWNDAGSWPASGEWSAYSPDTSVILGGTSGLKQGSYTFYVRAKDEADNEDPTPAQQSFQVDTPPAPPYIETPTNNYVNNNSNLFFEGYASELGSIDLFEGQNKVGTATIEAQDCIAGCIYMWGLTLEGVSNGTHTYYATATDETGHVSDPSDTVTVVVDDTTPPETSITSGPAEGSSTTSTSATFEFSSNEQGSTFKCQLYKDSTVAQQWADCTSPKSYANLTPGNYKFNARATDPAGNTDPTPASRSWTITSSSTDTTAPTVVSTASTADATGVAPTTDVMATFSEDMDASSINTNTFKLFKKGSTAKIDAAVSYSDSNSSAPRTAKLDPTSSLRSGFTYKAVVTTGVKDLAGNPLAQQCSWFFTVGK